MIKYAQNLIGDWETEQFEPLREVAQNKYQANWDKLSSDFANLNEQLAHNFQRARVKHNSAVLDNARNSFNRMYNVEQDLANRGLTGSGLMNVYSAMNSQQQGQENNAALQELMDANKANIEGRFTALDSLAKGMGDLSSSLGDELAGITEAEGDNLRAYRDLIGSISESAANRALESASASLSSKMADLEDEETDRYRKLSIYETLNDDTLSDDDKYKALVTELDVPVGDALKAISSYNYTKVQNKIDDAKINLQDYVKNKPFIPWSASLNSFKALNAKSKLNKIDKLEKELNDYTYTDLYDLLYK